MTEHFARHWKATPRAHRLSTGRFHELPRGFQVLEFHVGQTWRYATAGMGGLETFVATPEPNPRAIEFLYALAHFHHTGEPLGLGHTVNFGQDLWEGSGLDHGYLSYPYVEAEEFATFDNDDGTGPTAVAWLIPITAAERAYKKAYGVEALETLFEDHRLDYLNPSRPSLR